MSSVLLLAAPAYAAEASYEIKLSSSNIKVGDDFSLNVYVTPLDGAVITEAGFSEFEYSGDLQYLSTDASPGEFTTTLTDPQVSGWPGYDTVYSMPNCISIARQSTVGVTERSLLATFNFLALKPGTYIWNMLGNSCPAYHYIKLEDGQNLTYVDDTTSEWFTVYDPNAMSPSPSPPPPATGSSSNQSQISTPARIKLTQAKEASTAHGSSPVLSSKGSPKVLGAQITPQPLPGLPEPSTKFAPVKLLPHLADTRLFLPWSTFGVLSGSGILLAILFLRLRARKLSRATDQSDSDQRK